MDSRASAPDSLAGVLIDSIAPESDRSARVRVHRFQELHEYTDAIQDHDSAFVRFSTERMKAGVIRLALDRMVVLRGEGDFPHHASHATLPSRALAFAAAPCTDVVWHGEPFTETSLFSYAAGDEHVGQTRGHFSWAGVLFDGDALERHARALGYDPERARPGVVLSAPRDSMAKLRTALRRAVGLAAMGPRPLDTPSVRAAVEEDLLSAAVHATHPAWDQRSAAAASHERVVRSCFAWLESRPRDAVYLSELCAAARVSERTLRNAFQDLFGLSPIRYLHLRRMDLTRRELREADPRAVHVADVALRFGFTNLGRFASEFRQLYGVTPSQLLRRAR